jgi:hypothetical protein
MKVNVIFLHRMRALIIFLLPWKKQTVSNFELIVVLDASTDSSERILDESFPEVMVINNSVAEPEREMQVHEQHLVTCSFFLMTIWNRLLIRLKGTIQFQNSYKQAILEATKWICQVMKKPMFRI